MSRQPWLGGVFSTTPPMTVPARAMAAARDSMDRRARFAPVDLDATTGVVTFPPGHVPTAGARVTAGFRFDVPVIGQQTVTACAEAGIVGALTGVIGTLMAMEAIKLVTGAGEPLVGRLLLYDGLAARFETLKYKRRKSAS